MPETIRVAIGSDHVTALAYPPPTAAEPPVTLVLAHGAGASQTSGFMVAFAEALARRGSHPVTFNFPYTEKGRRLPDRPEMLEAAFRAVVAVVRAHAPLGRGRLVIGGKSMGGRIASQIAAQGLADLAGLVFLGYPLHPPGKPTMLRAAHLGRIREPMLFVQGSRDAFGTPAELAPVVQALGPHARIHVVEGGDHSFAVPKRGPVAQDEVFSRVQDEIARWLLTLA